MQLWRVHAEDMVRRPRKDGRLFAAGGERLAAGEARLEKEALFQIEHCARVLVAALVEILSSVAGKQQPPRRGTLA